MTREQNQNRGEGVSGRHNLWFQPDGMTAHTATRALTEAIIRALFPNRVILRFGVIH